MTTSNSTHATTGTTFWDEFQSIAERAGRTMDGCISSSTTREGKMGPDDLGTATARLSSLDDRGAKDASQ